MAERLSTKDQSLVRSWGNHIQRYQFAAPYCQHKRVMDAGCGVGYGSQYLARCGASSVVGIDLSVEAIEEADRTFTHSNVRFVVGELQALEEVLPGSDRFDVVINFENIEHLREPEVFLASVQKCLPQPEGMLLISTPNGDLSNYDSSGRLCNEFHVREFNRSEFVSLLSPFFAKIELWGQWQTSDAKLRIMNEEHVFDQLCEAYYNPFSRLGRVIKRAIGKPVASPPRCSARGDSYSWEYVIASLDDPPCRWEPTVLIAICS